MFRQTESLVEIWIWKPNCLERGSLQGHHLLAWTVAEIAQFCSQRLLMQWLPADGSSVPGHSRRDEFGGWELFLEIQQSRLLQPLQ